MFGGRLPAFKTVAVWGLGGFVGIFLAIQAIPYGRNHSNPPQQQEPAWDSQETRAMVVDACFDCHSNRTSWPWYGNIAPASWLVQHDVDGGRHALNFSEWDQPQRTHEIVEKVQEGEMPPSYYGWMHPNARLSSAERQALVQGLQATFGQGGTRNPDGENGEEGHEQE
jgi:mono/diheme cytochrome c family protein